MRVALTWTPVRPQRGDRLVSVRTRSVGFIAESTTYILYSP